MTLSELGKRYSCVYTRYADDIYFSTNKNNVLTDVMSEFNEIISNYKGVQLKINKSKTLITSPKRKKIVTGLVITSDKKVSIGRVNEHKKSRIPSRNRRFRVFFHVLTKRFSKRVFTTI